MLFKLYLVFFKIGIFAFGGGYAAIPLIQKYIVLDASWISDIEFRDLVSISQMTPGPIAINSATFVGQKVGGIVGSIVATLGFVTPQLILMLVLGYFLFSNGKKFKLLDFMLNGIKAGISALIFISAIDLVKSSFFPNGVTIDKISYAAIITFIISFILYLKRVSLFKLIGISIFIGIVVDYILKFM